MLHQATLQLGRRQASRLQPAQKLDTGHKPCSALRTLEEAGHQRHRPSLQFRYRQLRRFTIENLKQVTSSKKTCTPLTQCLAVGTNRSRSIMQPTQGVAIFVGDPETAVGVLEDRLEHLGTGAIGSLHQQGIGQGISHSEVRWSNLLAQMEKRPFRRRPVLCLEIGDGPSIMHLNVPGGHVLATQPLERTLEAAITWPTAAVLDELCTTDLLDTWMQRRIERELGKLAPLETLAHHWFASAATSLFLQRRADLDRCVFSILRLRDAELSQELYFRLLAGEADFPQLAHFSEGREQQLAGRLGPIAMGELHPLLAAQLRRAAPGQVLAPLEFEDGQILVLRLDLLLPAHQNEALQTQLEWELLQRWRQGEQERLLAQAPNPGQILPLELPGALP